MTELIWDGKYGPDGKKTSPVRLALPFQDVETVNESAQTRNLMLDLFARNQPGEWRNRLIWGDKKYVLPSLLPEFAGKIDLIYIDPPFATGADFSYSAEVPVDLDKEGEQGISFTKQPSIIEQKAYRDTWGNGTDSYAQWFYETLALLHELLAEDGNIFVHLGWQVSAIIKCLLDEVFGLDNLRNEIIWQRFNFHADANRFGTVHETLWYYVRGEAAPFNKQYMPVKDSLIQSHYTGMDADGRRYTLDNPTAPAHGKTGKSMRFGDKSLSPPPGAMWRWKQENIDRLWAEGKVVFNESGMPRVKRYLDETEGTAVHSIWTDVRAINSQAAERMNYPTQKPEALLERIIKASSNEGDLVLDCFAGSGTTAAVAEKLNRRWITADLGRFAIHTTRKRLLSIPDVRPFVVQNLGKYERQAWQSAEFGEDDQKAALAQARYRKFILDLYGAQPLNGYNYLHGLKAGRMVHVGSVDAPVLPGDIDAVTEEFWKAVGTDSGAATNSVDILGWDFAFELNEMGKQKAAAANLNLTFKRIPREVLEKKAVQQGDIRFFELAALDADISCHPGRTVSVTLKDFIISPQDVPRDVQAAITHWSQWIDYWAIDWDYKGDTFHNQWQSYRTKKEPRLQTSATSTYAFPGEHTIVIKVIDILGNDTTKSIPVNAQ